MLDSLDRAMVDSALRLLRLDPAELGFDKMWVEDDTFRLDVVERLMQHPLDLPPYVDTTTAVIDSFHRKPRELLDFIDRQLKVTLEGRPMPKAVRLPTLVFDLADPLRVWLTAINAAEPLRKRFYGALDSLELHDLMMAAPAIWSEAPDSVSKLLKGAWHRTAGLTVDTTRKVDTDRLLDIIRKLDMPAMIEASKIVVPTAQLIARGVADQSSLLEPLPARFPGVEGEVLYYKATEFGAFVIGGRGDNMYNGEFAAIIDIGGNDVYRGRTAGALGGGLGQPYALLIDLEGDDYYDARGLDVTHGAGFLGIGILIDRSGSDVYRSASYAQGAGLLGVGLLADHDGADDRRGGYFLQGAAHCGIGLLLDTGDGDDRYLSTCWAQGFAGTFGYGMLYDQGGDDTYFCGGEFLHEPLLPKDNRSFSGGFGMGWRPRAGGGIGVLYDDGTGNDFYDAEVMSFGSSYWYALGILVDGGGNDRYSLAHYGIGAGIHLSLGAFYDRGGDDQYRSRMGVVGGTPHDLSVGIFVDASGNDSYADCDGWGGSLTNSFGLFIDRLGDDTYAPRPGGTSLGRHNWARGFGGVAIFIDEEGRDSYPRDEPGADSSLWIQEGWGIGIDMARDVVTEKEEPILDPVLTAEDSARSVEDLFKDASQWEVGSARASVKRARKAILTKPEAVRWVIDNKISTQNSLELRPMEDLARAYPDSAGPLLTTCLTPKSDRWAVGNAAYLCGAIKWKPSVPAMMALLDDKRVEKSHRALLNALGQIGEVAASPSVAKFIVSEKERNRLASIGAAKALGDSILIDDLIARLDDKQFTVRSAAIEALSRFGSQVCESLVRYLENGSAGYPELGLRALAKILTADKNDTVLDPATRRRAVKAIERALESDQPALRAEAVSSLYRLGKGKTRERIAAKMDLERDPVVLAAYARAMREAGE